VCVLGIFVGVIFTVVSCCFTINVYTQFFYTFSTDPSIFPKKVYKDELNWRVQTFFICLGVGFLACLISLYISV
jgi:hypothetical protein